MKAVCVDVGQRGGKRGEGKKRNGNFSAKGSRVGLGGVRERQGEDWEVSTGRRLARKGGVVSRHQKHTGPNLIKKSVHRDGRRLPIPKKTVTTHWVKQRNGFMEGGC